MSTPLEKRLNDYPRIELTRTPTPLQYLPNLSDSLNLKIYIKRDDLTDLVLGGGQGQEIRVRNSRGQGTWLRYPGDLR